MKKPVVQTFKFSKSFRAPLAFVFGWCTDFREDDPKMIGSKTKRHILERTKRRVIWRVNYKDRGKEIEGVRAVWLSPPDSWHLDTCGDGRELGDYKLTSVGKNRTRLDMVFEETFEDPSLVPSKTAWTKDTKRHWDLYAKFLEQDYKKFQLAHPDA